MPPTESILSALECNWNMVDAALEGMDATLMSQRPNDQCNSIAWTLWHMNRVLDTLIHNRLQDKPTLWISADWYQKYGMAEAGTDESRHSRGVGWTAAEVAAWVAPSREIQMGYYGAVKDSARTYLPSCTQTDLDRRVVFPPLDEPRAMASVVGQVTWDNIAHGGQIAYLRGFYQGMGWFR